MDQPQKKLADYVVVAISPLLIMLLVGSLVFFLIQVFYRGEMIAGVRFAMFWFVVAIVLVTRIGIEHGKLHSWLYGTALAIATWIYLAYTHKVPVLGAILLAITWWCAHRLTVDCTLVPETRDDTGDGVFENLWRELGKQFAPGDSSPRLPPMTPLELLAAAELARRRAKNPPRRPGRWVFYFSIAALPLFGIGQLFLPADDIQSRRMAFVFLMLYLAAAFGLLVTTSFLGLRRYLRQRSVEMPASVTHAWIRFGALLAAGVLLISLILPRSGTLHALKNLTYLIPHKDHHASSHALPYNPPGHGDGAYTEQPTEQSQNSENPRKTSSGGGASNAHNNAPSSSNSSNPSSEPGTSGGGGGSGSGGSGGGGSGGGGGAGGDPGDQQSQNHPVKLKDVTPAGDADQPSDNKTPPAPEPPDPNPPEGGHGSISATPSGDRSQPGKAAKPHEPPKQQSPTPELPKDQPPKPQPKNGPGQPEPTDFWYQLLRALLILAAVIALIWVLIKFRKEIARFIRKLITAIQNYFRKLFRRRPRKPTPAASTNAPQMVLEPFDAYPNPFVTGKARSWPSERLLRYTYEAIQSWAKEQGIELKPQQTPREFCAELIARFPDLGPALEDFSFYYTHVAFAKQLPADFAPDSLRPLWDHLGDSVALASQSAAY